MKLIENILASIIIVLRNSFRLLIYPYETVRRISSENDTIQVAIIFTFVFLYFVEGNIVRKRTLHPFVISSSSLLTFAFFLITFFLTTVFFFFLAKAQKKHLHFKSLVITFSYGLLPTYIWFTATSLLYLLLPPPRTTSFLGLGFSFVFIAFSLTALLWKLILFYLSIRFSLKTDFYTTMFYILLYLLWFIPYSYGLYYLKIFRIPFI